MPAEVESMAWVGDRGLPWWVGTPADVARLKTELEGLATGREIREAAGLDWTVDKREIYVGRKGLKIPDKFATVRSDSGAPLGVVGRAYHPVQNDELDAWGDALVDSGDAKYETAGSLKGGRTVFFSMELDGVDVNIAGKSPDELKTYLLLTNSHDGSRALEAVITPVRVVCVNTLNMALGAKKASFRMRHVGGVEGKLAAAREALGITFRYTELFAEIAGKLALKKVVDEQVEEIMRSVFSSDIDDKRWENSKAAAAVELYHSSDTLDGIRGTAWGVLNAVAEYADWEAKFKGRGTSTAEDVRANSILFGQAKRHKEVALKLLQKA